MLLLCLTKSAIQSASNASFSLVNLKMSTIPNEAVILIKDVKPGSKNLNIVFIVLEIGKLITTKACLS